MSMSLANAERLGLLLATAAALSACQAPARTSEATRPPAAVEKAVELPTQVVLAVGESADLGDGRSLGFVKVVSDSRCPKDVQCVWAGEVKLAFELIWVDGKSAFELSSQSAKSASAAQLDFELQSYQACPATPARTPGAECASVALHPIAVR